MSTVNGMLHFDTYADYQNAVQFVLNSESKIVLQWLDKVGVSTIRGEYEKARLDECCPDENTDFVSFKNKYAGKVEIVEDEMNYYPTLRIPIRNWFLDFRGAFGIGKTVLYHTKDSLYSFADVDGSIANEKVIDPNTLRANLLDVHSFDPVFILLNNGVEDRECSYYTNRPSAWKPTQFQCTGNGCHATKDAWHTVYDYSTPLYSSLGNTYIIDFISDLNFEHRRKTLFGWTVCERTAWNITADYNLTHNIPTAPPSAFTPTPTNPRTWSLSTTTGEECKVNWGSSVLTYDMSGWPINAASLAVYNGRAISPSTIRFCGRPLDCTTSPTSGGATAQAVCPTTGANACF